MNLSSVKLSLAAIMLAFVACETGNVQPQCCSEPAGQLIWETYSQGNGFIRTNQVNGIARAPDANIWVASNAGLHVWDGKEWDQIENLQNLAPNIRTNDFIIWEDSLYLGSEVGVSVLRDYWHTFFGDSISTLGTDPDGGFWAASQNAKLWHFDGAFYEVDNPGDSQYEINFVYEEENGRLWLGAEDGQIHIREAGFWRSENLNSVPTSISQNPNGQIWIGTRGSGAFLYENAQQLDQFGQNEGALSNTINCLLFDERNRLWLGTDKGLNVISGLDTPDDILINFYDTSDGLVSNNVQNLLIVSETDWWVVTDQGISRRHIK